MRFLLIRNDVISNIIVSDESFATHIGALPYYDGAKIGQTYSPPYTPTLEERTAALESAMLSMMGVNIDV